MPNFATVSWFRRNVEASSIYFPPETFLSVYQPDREKSLKPTANVLSCPAVIKRRSDLFIIRCPYDLRLRYIGKPGQGHVHVMHPGTSILDSKIKSIFALSDRVDWASPDIPVIQLMTPYVFIADEGIDLVQLNDPMQFGGDSGYRLIEGRFPIDKWVRPISFAVEWIDTGKDIVLRRGNPWFALQFCLRENFDAKIKLTEISETDDLSREITRNSGVTSYIKGTSALFHDRS